MIPPPPSHAHRFNPPPGSAGDIKDISADRDLATTEQATFNSLVQGSPLAPPKLGYFADLRIVTAMSWDACRVTAPTTLAAACPYWAASRTVS